MTDKIIVISPSDNVGVAVVPLKAGEKITANGQRIEARADVPKNHKIAIRAIAANAAVIKYGEPIGTAGENIEPGDWVHTHNLKAAEDKP